MNFFKLDCLFILFFLLLLFHISSAPELCSVWTPTLKKSMSHPTSQSTNQVNGRLYKHLEKVCTIPSPGTSASTLPDAYHMLNTQKFENADDKYCNLSINDGLSTPEKNYAGRTQSPTKMRLNFLEGFRNTLRSRTKSDATCCNDYDWSGAKASSAITSSEEKAITRRWSEAGSPNVVRPAT